MAIPLSDWRVGLISSRLISISKNKINKIKLIDNKKIEIKVVFGIFFKLKFKFIKALKLNLIFVLKDNPTNFLILKVLFGLRKKDVWQEDLFKTSTLFYDFGEGN